MSERLDDAIKGRIAAQNEAGEAKSELVIIQVSYRHCHCLCYLRKNFTAFQTDEHMYILSIKIQYTNIQYMQIDIQWKLNL